MRVSLSLQSSVYESSLQPSSTFRVQNQGIDDIIEVAAVNSLWAAFISLFWSEYTVQVIDDLSSEIEHININSLSKHILNSAVTHLSPSYQITTHDFNMLKKEIVSYSNQSKAISTTDLTAIFDKAIQMIISNVEEINDLDF